MYLLDTTIISAARLPHHNPAVARWLRAVPDRDLFAAALVLGEIEQGIRRREPTDAAQGAVLRDSLETAVVPSFGAEDRALLFDHRPGPPRQLPHPGTVTLR